MMRNFQFLFFNFQSNLNFKFLKIKSSFQIVFQTAFGRTNFKLFAFANFLKKNQIGFTLLEILVVIAIVTTVGIILTQIFISTLQASNKAQMISRIKQNGQNALDIMDKEIRDAWQVLEVCDSGRAIKIEDRDRGYKRFRFVMPTLTKNGYVTQEIVTKDLQCVELEPPVTGFSTLTDINAQRGVSVGASSGFTIHSQAGSKDSVTIDFTLGPAVGAARIIREQVDPVEFKTTVSLR